VTRVNKPKINTHFKSRVTSLGKKKLGQWLHLPYIMAPINASPAPVVSISSESGIFSAVPIKNLPQTVPNPFTLNFVTTWENKWVKVREKYIFSKQLSLLSI